MTTPYMSCLRTLSHGRTIRRLWKVGIKWNSLKFAIFVVRRHTFGPSRAVWDTDELQSDYVVFPAQTQCPVFSTLHRIGSAAGCDVSRLLKGCLITGDLSARQRARDYLAGEAGKAGQILHVDLREASKGRTFDKLFEKQAAFVNEDEQEDKKAADEHQNTGAHPAASSDVDADDSLRSDIWPIVIPVRMAEALKPDSKYRDYTIVAKTKKDIYNDIGKGFFRQVRPFNNKSHWLRVTRGASNPTLILRRLLLIFSQIYYQIISDPGVMNNTHRDEVVPSWRMLDNFRQNSYNFYLVSSKFHQHCHLSRHNIRLPRPGTPDGVLCE